MLGGPSGPMLSAQIAAIRNKSVGPEGPPTTAALAAETMRLIASSGRCTPRLDSAA
ncbi:DUF6053 domain-containing protein [Lysobacter enzymogenes]|uniref:DUF6053 domain-containing protein n=1 Tax=Lysobacter enzymogenes TaxID=69 RepID=UPI003D2F8220